MAPPSSQLMLCRRHFPGTCIYWEHARLDAPKDRDLEKTCCSLNSQGTLRHLPQEKSVNMETTKSSTSTARGMGYFSKI